MWKPQQLTLYKTSGQMKHSQGPRTLQASSLNLNISTQGYAHPHAWMESVADSGETGH